MDRRRWIVRPPSQGLDLGLARRESFRGRDDVEGGIVIDYSHSRLAVAGRSKGVK